jgi:hypothetical protein
VSDYLYSVTGYLPDGRRIKRRYKTYAAADRMAKRMSFVSFASLKAIPYSQVVEALKRAGDLDGNAIC